MGLWVNDCILFWLILYSVPTIFFFLHHFYAPVLAKKLIDKKLEMIQQRVDNKQDVEGEYLTYLLSNTQMSTKDVYGSVTELLLAGVDTVNGIPILVIKHHM